MSNDGVTTNQRSVFRSRDLSGPIRGMSNDGVTNDPGAPTLTLVTTRGRGHYCGHFTRIKTYCDPGS